jgi:hypothetical protein
MLSDQMSLIISIYSKEKSSIKIYVEFWSKIKEGKNGNISRVPSQIVGAISQ